MNFFLQASYGTAVVFKKDVEISLEISLYLTGIFSPMYGSCLKTSMIFVRRA